MVLSALRQNNWWRMWNGFSDLLTFYGSVSLHSVPFNLRSRATSHHVQRCSLCSQKGDGR
jgi:hypothetical protein